MDLDSKELENEMRKHSDLFEFDYQVEQLKVTIAEELQLEQIVRFLDRVIIKIFRLVNRCH